MPQDPMFLLSANLFVAVLLRVLKPNLLTASLLTVVLIGSSGFLGARYAREIMDAAQRGRDLALIHTGNAPSWPPRKFRVYPDLELIDQEGNLTRLSDFKGKLILLEPIGMSCPACVAFSGGHRAGGFQGVEAQHDLKSIEDYTRKFGRVRLDDERIVFVQLILFNQAMTAPTPQEVEQWADHFQLNRAENEVALAGTASLANAVSRELIPGFQLIDQDFVLRADSTGHDPDDLYTHLLPLLRKLLKEGEQAN